MANSETIGGRIKKCRKEAKLTQESLAELFDISPTYLSEIETNRKQAGLQVLCRIAEELGVSLDYLVFSQGEHTEEIKPVEWKILLEDCSKYERCVLYELVCCAKDILRANQGLFERK